MKPPAFAYRRAESAGEAVEQLAAGGEDAKLIAGGQSLLPMLALRLARPSMLVDVSRIAALRYVRRDGDELRIGALTRHRDIPASIAADGDGGFAALARATRWIGHEPIRTRGTFGGSLAHADPAAEWPLLAVLLDAELVVLGPRGERTLPAGAFFLGYLTPALEADEMLVEARFPKPWRATAFHEHARRHGDFALASAAAAVEVGTDGTCRAARVALGAVDQVPLRVAAAEASLTGTRLENDALDAAVAVAVAEIHPISDVHASGGHRRRLAGVLLRRALDEARARAAGTHASCTP